MRGTLRVWIAAGMVTGCAFTRGGPDGVPLRGAGQPPAAPGERPALPLPGGGGAPVAPGEPEQVSGPGGPLAFAQAPEPVAASPEEAPLPGHGHITVRVRWPERSVQYIPMGTAKLTFKAQASGATFSRDLTPQDRKAVLKNVPAGPAVLSAEALDGSGKVLASASVQVTVVSGAVISPKLVLVDTMLTPVVISALVPQFGGAGKTVTLKGSGFGSDSSKFKVFVGGQAITGGLFPIGSEASFNIPSWATESVVTVEVVTGNSTQSATCPDRLYRLKALVPVPSSISLKVGATGSVGITGVDVLDGTRSIPPNQLTWTAASGADSGTHDHSGEPGGHGGAGPIQVNSWNGWISVTASGDYHVMARSGDLLATASVTAAP